MGAAPVRTMLGFWNWGNGRYTAGVGASATFSCSATYPPEAPVSGKRDTVARTHGGADATRHERAPKGPDK